MDSPDIVLTFQAQQAMATAQAASSKQSTPVGECLMRALLENDATDAHRSLLACGVDPQRIVEALHTRQQDAAGSERADTDPIVETEALLTSAREESAAVGSLWVSTRDLLIATLRRPSPRLAPLLHEMTIDLGQLRNLAVQVYERPEAPKTQETKRTTRFRWWVSPIFLALVAGMIGSGLYLYRAPEPNQGAVFLFILCGWIVSLSLHEFGHALTGYFAGDKSVIDQGYLTLNPLKYTHVLTSIVMPIFILLIGGIGLPGGAVYIDRSVVRSRQMNSLISAAGPFANMLFAVLLAVPFLRDVDMMDTFFHLDFYSALAFLILLQVSAILLNLLPIPGLDGFGIIALWLPDEVHQRLYPLYSFGFLILIMLFFYVDPFSEWFWTEAFRVLAFFKVDPGLASLGYDVFTFWN